jgi:hypothetical protein
MNAYAISRNSEIFINFKLVRSLDQLSSADDELTIPSPLLQFHHESFSKSHLLDLYGKRLMKELSFSIEPTDTINYETVNYIEKLSYANISFVNSSNSQNNKLTSLNTSTARRFHQNGDQVLSSSYRSSDGPDITPYKRNAPLQFLSPISVSSSNKQSPVQFSNTTFACNDTNDISTNSFDNSPVIVNKCPSYRLLTRKINDEIPVGITSHDMVIQNECHIAHTLSNVRQYRSVESPTTVSHSEPYIILSSSSVDISKNSIDEASASVTKITQNDNTAVKDNRRKSFIPKKSNNISNISSPIQSSRSVSYKSNNQSSPSLIPKIRTSTESSSLKLSHVNLVSP